MKPGPDGPAPPPPRGAAEILGDRLPLAVAYAELLATTGIEHGLLGPREAPRLWDRHILNCAVVESLLPHRSRIIDIGSGAGLPGLALALARPDLQITLIEPMQRRTVWLETTIAELGLTQVGVLRGRAQEFAGRLQAPIVTARAVARLEQLARWVWPLLPAGGRLLALKGQSAQVELDESLRGLQELGLSGAEVVDAGIDVLDPPTRVISLVKSGVPPRFAAGPVRSPVQTSTAARRRGPGAVAGS